MKKVLYILLAAFAAQLSTAQEKTLKDSPLDFSVDLKTSHLWRGLIISDRPMAAVFLKLKLDKSGSFSTGFWGGVAFANESDGTSYQEINYYVQYAKNGLSLGLWNLFNTRGAANPNVWDYDKKTTYHFLDLRTSYHFGKSFPLTLEADVLLFGSRDGQYTNLDFEQRYSTYVQVSYPLIKESKVDVSAFVGAGFSLNGNTHLYGDGTQNFDLVNVGLTASKTVKFGDHSVPFSVNTLWNPSVKYARVQLIVHLF
ncbi:MULTISPECIES: hypothetical protein [unclassified Polaribacter]|uniref:hypothetical protein n=1 Tax=unclassified Polaribacter TaxID=196858 RepID=UPI0011BE6A04|nr:MULTISPECIES: hypothetical protein [unclassified Polaribacter]TXD54460.1 hypothetical protein ES043_01020 [Polaribacter sp. IC063]TXD60373.1 hypothetical protein ES044_07850 [Polaribacter sp. IC066]